MQATKEQIIKIHALLPVKIKADKEAKQDFIFSITNDSQRGSTAQLTYQEADSVINNLSGKNNAHYASFVASNKQHLYLLSLCRQMGWVAYHNQRQEVVADLAALGSWIKDYGYLHKPLKQYTATELPKLITQFEKVLKSKL